jgi:hypothetical protein
VSVNQNVASHVLGVKGINNEMKGITVMKTGIFYFTTAINIDF